MKWHNGLPDDWADLPDLEDGKREVPPRRDVPDQNIKATMTAGVLVVRRERSSTAYIAGDHLDLEECR